MTHLLLAIGKKHFDINTLPVDAQGRFSDLMDKYIDIFVCSSEVRRPVMDGDSKAVLDFDLIHEHPIFVKPYPLNPKLTEILDQKLDEFLERGDIVAIDSPY